MTALIGYERIAEKTGYSRRYVVRTITKLPGFPPPAIRLSRKSIRWLESDVDKFLLGTRRK